MLSAEQEVPQLTTTRKADGFQFELMIRVRPDEDEITKVRIGPYLFKKAYRPRTFLGGLIQAGGPENIFWMHRGVPPGWSRPRWETALDEPGQPVYLSWTGHLSPGAVGIFRFLSIYPPGGLRVGLILHRGSEVTNYGVTGPNYEAFEEGDHH